MSCPKRPMKERIGNMRVTIGLCWGYIGIMEKKMETTIVGYVRGGSRGVGRGFFWPSGLRGHQRLLTQPTVEKLLFLISKVLLILYGAFLLVHVFPWKHQGALDWNLEVSGEIIEDHNNHR